MLIRTATVVPRALNKTIFIILYELQWCTAKCCFATCLLNVSKSVWMVYSVALFTLCTESAKE